LAKLEIWLPFGHLGFKSLSRRDYKRFNVFSHQLYKGGKAQGILIDTPSYLSNGMKQVRIAEHVLEAPGIAIGLGFWLWLG